MTEAATEAGVVETEAETAVETEAETEKKPDSVLKDVKWSDFQIALDGEVMEFPMSVDSLKEDGWLLEAAYKGTELEPYNYVEAQAKKDDHIAYFYIANMTDQKVVSDEATAVGIKVSENKWPLDDLTVVELPGGVFRGISTEQDLLDTYGEPDGSFALDGVTTYSYIINEYERFDVEINSSGVVDGFKMINFTIPEGVEVKEVTPEPTETVKAYKADEKLSDSLTDFDINTGDLVVTLPAPVNFFIENGWELTDGEGAITPHGESWITLTKGDKTLDTIAVNIEETSQAVENCWVDSIDFGVDYNEDFEISGGIKVGSTKEDVLNAIADANIEYTESEIGDYTYIEYNTTDMQTGVMLSIYTGDGTEYKKDTVTYISIYKAYPGTGVAAEITDETEADATAAAIEVSTEAVSEAASEAVSEAASEAVSEVAE